MSLTPQLSRPVVVAGIAAIALVVGGLTFAAQSGDEPSSETRVRTPKKSLDLVAVTTPAESAVAVSRRLYAASPVVIVTDAASQALAVDAASKLDVPVLIDDASSAAEIKRLGAKTVLTFGATRDLNGSRAVTTANAAREIARVRDAYDLSRPRKRNVFVLTGSAEADAVAAATATNAGARVVELPGGDPRTDATAVKAFADQPRAPVIALGAPFGPGLEYTLAAVRSGVEQIGGGYLALPGRTMVALYGHPSTSALGVLGEQGVAASVKRAQLLATKYRAVVKTPVVPTFEIIATVASASAGKDKNYSRETKISDLLPLIDAADKAGVYVILDLQPGRTDFLVQAKRYESLLKRPHVGLALDPEWRLRPKQKHLVQIGKVSVNEVNRVGDWLAALTKANDLPQKVFVVHQFSITMIKGRARLDTSHPELATVIHVDGHGSQPDKKGTWNYLREKAPAGVFWGWKNFVDEDSPMLNVKQTWTKVKPHPDLITYQ